MINKRVRTYDDVLALKHVAKGKLSLNMNEVVVLTENIACLLQHTQGCVSIGLRVGGGTHFVRKTAS